MGISILAAMLLLPACGGSGGPSFAPSSVQPPASAPTIFSVSPSTGPTTGGTNTAIKGANFQSGATVSFGGVAATSVAFASSAQLTATSPKGNAGTVDVVVTNPDAQTGTLANGFTYTSSGPAPTISGVSPNTGPTTGGTLVLITGTNFQTGATVIFGSTAATVTFVSSTQLKATTPPEPAGAVGVVVRNLDGQSSAPSSQAFTFVTPGGLAVNVEGTTSTQAVLSYDAPDANPCTLQVTPSATSLAPPVYAVDPTLFPGGNSDGGTTAGPRTFVVGKRTIATAANGNNYSLALENNTQYDFQATCGTQVFQGGFTTTNIPLGKTFGEPAIVESDGNQIFPTIPDIRGHSLIDPMTGTLMKVLTVSTDTTSGNWDNPGWYSGGFMQACSPVEVNGGYLCIVPGTQSFSHLYWINPAGGTSHWLGVLQASAGSDYVRNFPGSFWDPTLAGTVYNIVQTTQTPAKLALIQGTFTGSTSPDVATDAVASFSWTNLTPVAGNDTLTDLMTTFDSSYSPTNFPNCGIWAVQGNYVIFSCHYYQQNSPAWDFVADLGSKTPGSVSIVAGGLIGSNPQTRWCGLHDQYFLGNVPLAGFEIHSTISGGASAGPWEVSLTSAVGSADTTFYVSGKPATPNAPSGQSATLRNVAPGDIFVFAADGTNECVEITRVSGTTWTVQRGVYCGDFGQTTTQAHASGALLYAECSNKINQSADVWWKFLNDPHMQDASGTNYIDDSTGTCHRVSADFLGNSTGYDICSGWTVRTGFPNSLLQDPSFVLDESPAFAGIVPLAAGNSYQKHPSYSQIDATTDEQKWFLDVLPLQGIIYSTDSAVNVASDLYQYQLGSGHQFSTALPYFALSGDRLLKDISGPGSAIDGTAADNYEFCVAQNPNECVSGSSAGNIYFNVPALVDSYCAAQAAPGTVADICIQNTSAYGESLVQMGLTLADQTGTTKYWSGLNTPSANSIPVYGAGRSRVLLSPTMLGNYRMVGGFTNGRALPDASWALVPALSPITSNVTNPPKRIFLVKIPPQPPVDGIDRSNYVPVPIQVPTVTSAATAKVFYGYEEDGARSAFYCTQQPDPCSVSSVPGSLVNLPGVPQRVLFYEVEYLDNSGNVLGKGPVNAAAVP